MIKKIEGEKEERKGKDKKNDFLFHFSSLSEIDFILFKRGTFLPTSHQVDQRKAYESDGHLDYILTLNERPDGHHSIKGQGNEDHTVNPCGDAVAHENPHPLHPMDMGFPEGKDLGIDERTDDIGRKAGKDNTRGASQNPCKSLLP